MNKFAFILTTLLFTQFSVAADRSPVAAMLDSQSTIMVDADKYNWFAVALIEEQGFTKVREFHDMGSHGVQQIDYVVNCATHTLALADFAVLTEKGRSPANPSEATISMLTFYKPLIEHDKKITANVCNKQVLALGKTLSTPEVR